MSQLEETCQTIRELHHELQLLSSKNPIGLSPFRHKFVHLLDDVVRDLQDLITEAENCQELSTETIKQKINKEEQYQASFWTDFLPAMVKWSMIYSTQSEGDEQPHQIPESTPAKSTLQECSDC